LNKTLFKFLSLIVFVSCFLPGRSQDPIYSQFFNNPIYYNPAYVGISEGLQVRLNYRKQWPNLPGEYNSYNLNLDLASRNLPGSGGIGLMVDKHTAGTGYFERLKVGIPISVRIPLSESLLVQMGIMTSFIQKSLDWNSFVFMDQLDPRFGNIYPSSFTPPSASKVTYPDFDIGMALRWFTSGYAGKEYIFTSGVAIHHAFRPNESFFDLNSPLARRLVITGDLIIQDEYYERPFSSKKSSARDFRINPGFIYESQQDFHSLSIGFNAYKSNLYVGLWYRTERFDFTESNALVIMTGINTYLNDGTKIKFMYSFDMMLSKVYSRAAGGTHEISIILELNLNSQLISRKPNRRKLSSLESSPF